MLKKSRWFHKTAIQKLHYMSFIKAMEAKIISDFIELKKGGKKPRHRSQTYKIRSLKSL